MTGQTYDPMLQLLACRYLRPQLEVLDGHLEGARGNKDIEDVHQVRVACRRLGQAMEIYADCFDPKKLRQWKKRIKRLLKRFGEARDKDVQMEFLDTLLKEIDPKDRKIRPGLVRMHLRWKQHRQAIQPKVVKAVNELRKNKVVLNMHMETERILFALKHDPSQKTRPGPAFVRRSQERIGVRLNELLVKLDTLNDPDDEKGHHELRIAAKKLRYTMEICHAGFEDSAKPLIKKLKHLQTLLGALHDCDVWVQTVQDFMEQERKRTEAYSGNARPFYRLRKGLLFLIDNRREQRQSLFSRICEYAESLKQAKYWDQITDFVSREPEQAVQDECGNGVHGHRVFEEDASKDD